MSDVEPGSPREEQRGMTRRRLVEAACRFAKARRTALADLAATLGLAQFPVE